MIGISYTVGLILSSYCTSGCCPMSIPTPNIHLLSSIDNSGNLEYRGGAVYPYLVPELQN